MKPILSLFCASLCLWGQSAGVRVGQANTYTGNFLQDFSAANIKIRAATVATLPSAASNTRVVFLVTDGSTSGDCTVGGGSTYSFCTSNGSAWINPGGAGGGSGYPTVEINGTTLGSRGIYDLLPGPYTTVTGVDTGVKLQITNNIDIGQTNTLYLARDGATSTGATSDIDMGAGLLRIPSKPSYIPTTTGYFGQNSSTGKVAIGYAGATRTLATENISTQPLLYTATNAGTTGTTANRLAKINSSGEAVVTATTDTNGAVGVVTAGAGTSGTASIAVIGAVLCEADNTVTALDYIIIGTATAGRCRSGGTTYPTSGQIIGRAMSGASAGSTFTVLLFGLGQQGSSGGGSGTARQMLFATPFGAVGNGAYWAKFAGGNDWFTSGGGDDSNRASIMMPRSGTITRLSVRTTTTHSNGADLSIGIRFNGSNDSTLITITDGTAAGYFTATLTKAFVAGDIFTVWAFSNNSASAIIGQIALEVEY